MPDFPFQQQHNIEAEQAVLGALISAGDMIAAVRDAGLDQADFFWPVHRGIFYAMCRMNDKGVAIDMVTIRDELQRCDLLDDVGGQVFLTSLTGVPGAKPVHVLHYSWIVRKSAMERKLGETAIGMATMIDGRDTLPADARPLVEKMDRLVRTLASRTNTDSEMKCVYEHVLNKITGEVEDDTVIDTGLYRLNGLLDGGLRRTDFVTIAARTGVGKSALAAAICRHAATHCKLPVALYSYEMSKEQMVQRMMAAMSGVALTRIRKGNFGPEEQSMVDRLVHALAVLDDSPLAIIEASGMDSDELAADIIKRSGKGLAIACVDYLQLVSVPDKMIRANRATQVGYTTALMKQVAGKSNCCILGLSQLNRMVEFRNGDPQLSDLRESGSIEQDSNQVVFLYDAGPKMQSGVPDGFKLQFLDCQKNRNGSQGKTQIYYRGAFTRYQDTTAAMEMMAYAA